MMSQNQNIRYICEFNEFRKPINVSTPQDIIPSIKRTFENTEGFNPRTLLVQYEDQEGYWLDLDNYEDLQHRNSNKLKIICRQINIGGQNGINIGRQNGELSEEEKREIRLQIINENSNTREDIERATQVLEFLEYVDKPENRKRHQGIGSAYWNILKHKQRYLSSFKKTVEHIYKESFTEEHFCANYIDKSLEINKDCRGDSQGFNLNMKTVLRSFTGLGSVWKYIPNGKQVLIMDAIKGLVVKITAKEIACLSSAIEKAAALGALMGVALSAVWLTWEAISSIWKWYKGEISGRRCLKIIIDSFVTTGVSLAAGFAAGAAAGSVLGPPGAIAGGIVASLAAGIAADVAISRATQILFELPKDVAVEKAYVYFGLKCTAVNDEVNTAYRKKCLETHPDKGGTHKDFHTTQVMMEIIKVSRNDGSNLKNMKSS